MLIRILAHNPEECRAYIASRPELGQLDANPGWPPNTIPAPTATVPNPLPQNNSLDILTNEAVAEIKKEAYQELIVKLIRDSKNAEHLQELLDATTQSELQTALKKIGFPDRPPVLLSYVGIPLSPRLISEATTQEKIIRENRAKENFKSYVSNLSEAELIAKKDVLEGKLDFAEGLDEPYKTDLADLSEEEIKELRGTLGARYLQVVFSTAGGDLLDALNAPDDELEEEINALWGEDEGEDGGFYYIEEAVASNPALIRQGMLKNLILNQDNYPVIKNNLHKINSAKTLEEFTAGLKTLGITNVDWIEEDEWQEMQQWSRSRTLEMIKEDISELEPSPQSQAFLKQINTAKTLDEFKAGLKKQGIQQDWMTSADMDGIREVSRSRAFEMYVGGVKLGVNAHPQLLAVLNNLPQEKQEALLAKPEQIRHLLNAKDANAVELYLGRGAQGITEIVAENERAANFHRIHNEPMARILFNLIPPPLTLNAQQIKEINAVIKDMNATDFNVSAGTAAYKVLVDKIGVASGLNGEIFYKAFGLNSTGTALLPTTDTFNPKIDIIKPMRIQQEHNLPLLAAFHNRADLRNKAIINTLLRIEKTAPLSDAHIDKINGYFEKSRDLKAFLANISADPDPAINGLKTGIQHELTPLVYTQVKIQSLAAPLRGNDRPLFKKAMVNMEAIVEKLAQIREPFSQSADKFQIVADINSIHLASPQFIRECKGDPNGMRAKFGEMADTCDVIVNQLLRNKALLLAQLANLPDPDRGAADYHDRLEEINELRNKVSEELEATEKSLATFQGYQSKLSGPSGILNAIDKAIDGKENYYYKPANFKATVIKGNSNTIQTTGPSGAPSPVSASTGSTSPVSGFLTGERLGPGDKCEYEMNHVVTSGQPPTTFKADGKFTERHDKTASSAPAKLKDGKITKQQECTFVVDKIPTQTQPPLGAHSAPDARLTEAKANFYLGMAVAILSRYDPSNPPSKDNPIRMNGTNEEEMRHLWTALVIVGEKNGKNMRFGRDAIEVESGPFKPSQERGMLGFKSSSLYSEYKKNFSDLINSKTKDAQSMAKTQTEHLDSVKQAEKGMEKYKKGVSEIRANVTESKKVMEEEGAAPEKPTPGFRK